MVKIIIDKIKDTSELTKLNHYLSESGINRIMYPSVSNAWCAEQVEKFDAENKYAEGYSKAEQLDLKYKMVAALQEYPEMYINNKAISIILKNEKDKFDHKK